MMLRNACPGVRLAVSENPHKQSLGESIVCSQCVNRYSDIRRHIWRWPKRLQENSKESV